MEPGAAATTTTQTGATLTSPVGSRVSLPLVDGGANSSTPMGAAESLFAALGTPPLSGPPTRSSTTGTDDPRREVFSDLRRFVNGFRRDAQPPS